MSKEKQTYEELSVERKKLQEEGKLPEWYTTLGWQLFKQKYLYQAGSFKEQIQRIADTAASHLPEDMQSYASQKFFDMMFAGELSPATPVLSNTGTNRGLPVSCQGQYFGDSLLEFYNTKRDIAVHSQNGFGTSGYLGDIRPRGAKISRGGKAEGILPLLKGLVGDMQYVSQGSTRRGSFAGYLPLMHPDAPEIMDFANAFPEDLNIGWNWYDKDTQAMNDGDEKTLERFQNALALKMKKGRGYFMFPDKANRLAPEAIKRSGISIKASNLC